MNKKNINLIIGVVAVIAAAVLLAGRKNNNPAVERLVTPSIGSVESYVTATATVAPQNRLEIKPPIAGRVEKILVEEGRQVKAGEVLALMSSTDRAALLDAARLQGEETLKSWEDVYKLTPLLAPADGEVIVKDAKPGQTVTTSEVILVLSDRLILQAQVDETDIGKVKLGQTVRFSLDAYPQIEVTGKVDHVYYESTVVSNVTVYFVDIVPDEVPDVFRSGMSANVKIVRERAENVLLLPQDAVQQENGKYFVLLRQGGKKVRQEVQAGLTEEGQVQIVSGLAASDQVVLSSDAVDFSTKTKQSTNPFMPTPPKSKKGK